MNEQRRQYSPPRHDADSPGGQRAAASDGDRESPLADDPAQAPSAPGRDHLGEALRGAGRVLTESIRRSPALSIGIAIGCGALLGWIVKRR